MMAFPISRFDKSVVLKREATAAVERRNEGVEHMKWKEFENTTWPILEEDDEWVLRYGSTAAVAGFRYCAASILHAYGYLTDPKISDRAAMTSLRRARAAVRAVVEERDGRDGRDANSIEDFARTCIANGESPIVEITLRADADEPRGPFRGRPRFVETPDGNVVTVILTDAYDPERLVIGVYLASIEKIR